MLSLSMLLLGTALAAPDAAAASDEAAATSDDAAATSDDAARDEDAAGSDGAARDEDAAGSNEAAATSDDAARDEDAAGSDEAARDGVAPDDAASDDAACRAEAVFPGDQWVVDLEAADPAAVAALEAYLFPPDLDWADEERRGARTDAVVIVHHGRIVYERYDHGYTAETPHLAWSATKTVGAFMAGFAVGEGRLDVDASICAYVDAPEATCAVRVRDLLAFASGLDWRETYEGLPPTTSSVIAMLYGEGEGDMAAFVAGHALRDPPGTAYAYSSGDSNLLAAAWHAVLLPAHGERYPWTLLFEPLQMSGVTWERDGRGVPVASSYLWATPRDLARLGLFLREDGCWGGERLLPEGWIADMSAVSDALRTKAYARDEDDVQGRQLWLNQPVPEQGLDRRPWPSVPEDAVAALGHWGQSITAIPSADLVVVRVADDRDGAFSKDRLLSLALAVAGQGAEAGTGAAGPAGPAASNAPLPEDPQRYDTGLFGIATGVKARWTCSCRFVMGRDEAFCDEWTRVSPNIAGARVDEAAGTVRSRALGFAPTVARTLGPEAGCVLEE